MSSLSRIVSGKMMHCGRPRLYTTDLLPAKKLKMMKIILAQLQLLELIRELQKAEPKIRSK